MSGALRCSCCAAEPGPHKALRLLQPVAVPDQRRTTSRFLRPQIMDGLVYALALHRIRDTGLAHARSPWVQWRIGVCIWPMTLPTVSPFFICTWPRTIV